MSDKEVSDLKIVECPKCKAVWMNGQHVWATGKMGNELDLAGLVCNRFGDDSCINPKRGCEGGDSWSKRAEDLENRDV